MAIDCNQARYMLESFDTALERISVDFANFAAKSKTKEQIDAIPRQQQRYI
jgi:hypothetical protein